MKQQSIYKWCVPLSLSLLTLPALANDIEVQVSATSRFTDNARRTETATISERQDIYGLDLVGDYSNSLIAFDADYRATENRFNEESQPDRSLVEGNAELLIGKQYHPVDLLLSHSRRSLQSAPDQVSLLEDEDEREIFSAIPTLRWRLGEVDNLLVRGDITTINYRYSGEFNSERKGGSLLWQHALSPIDSIEVSAQHTEIEYDALPDNDYIYQNAAVTYSTDLRQLSYLVSLGYNLSKPATGDEFSAPSYRLELDYRSGFNTLGLYLSQRITDTSLGNGNRTELGNINLGDAGSIGIDQFESRVVELRWRTQGICGRCSAYASILYQADDYQSLDEDNNQHVVSAGFDYRLSRAASLGILIQRSERRFDESVLRNDFQVTSSSINYRYVFVSDLELGVFAAVDRSNSDTDSLRYEERVSGVSLRYIF